MNEPCFQVESGEDVIHDRDYSGFTGEACFYFVRSIVSREPVSCIMNVGCSGEFCVYLDGKEMLHQESVRGWALRDFQIPFECDGVHPVQLVLKTVRRNDFMSLSVCFIKKDVTGDKTKGISYLHDDFGDNCSES